MRDNQKSGNQKLLAWCGPACVLFTIIGLVVIARLIPPPPAYLSAEEVASLYRDHPFSIKFGLFLAIGATSLLIPFSGAISLRMISKDRESIGLALAQLAGGATGAIVLIIAFILMMAAAFDPARPIEITKALHDTGWLLLLLPYSPFCVQYISIAIAVMRGGASTSMFPRWIAYYNIWISVSFIPTGLVAFFKIGAFTWHGLIGFWIPTISYAGWFLVMSYSLLKPTDLRGT